MTVISNKTWTGSEKGKTGDIFEKVLTSDLEVIYKF